MLKCRIHGSRIVSQSSLSYELTQSHPCAAVIAKKRIFLSRLHARTVPRCPVSCVLQPESMRPDSLL